MSADTKVLRLQPLSMPVPPNDGSVCLVCGTCEVSILALQKDNQTMKTLIVALVLALSGTGSFAQQTNDQGGAQGSQNYYGCNQGTGRCD
jgi:hypothetical protein